MITGATEALAAILKRIADFFELLDLSFFVGGGLSAGALAIAAKSFGVPFPGTPGSLVDLVVAVLLVYVLGLGAFAVGRTLRRPVVKRFPAWMQGEDYTAPFAERLDCAVRDHRLEEDPIVAPYLDDGKVRRRVYQRLWAEVRERPELKESYRLLQRYWVLAATYDSVAFASLLWAVAVGASTAAPSPAVPAAAVPYVVVLFLLFALASLNEASRYSKSQVEELVATVAHLARVRVEQKEALQDTSTLAGTAPVV